jgi:ketosteroid isomerase-like protein
MSVEEPAADNLELVRAHYDAFARGDFDTLLQGLDPEVVITIHDEHGKPEGEPIRGREGAQAFFSGIGAAVSDRTVEIEHLRANEDKVLAHVLLGGTLRKTGEPGEIRAVHLHTLYEGSICEIRTYRPDWRG